MAKEKITLETIAEQLAKMDVRVTDGFAKHGKEIKELTESVAHLVEHMATKDQLVVTCPGNFGPTIT